MKFNLAEPAWYSGLQMPNYKGLVEQGLEFETRVLEQNNVYTIEITMIYVLLEIDGGKRFEPCRTFVEFTVIREKEVTVADVFPMISQAIDIHRSFMQKNKNVNPRLLIVPEHSMEDLMRHLIDLCDLLNRELVAQ